MNWIISGNDIKGLIETQLQAADNQSEPHLAYGGIPTSTGPIREVLSCQRIHEGQTTILYHFRSAPVSFDRQRQRCGWQGFGRGEAYSAGIHILIRYRITARLHRTIKQVQTSGRLKFDILFLNEKLIFSFACITETVLVYFNFNVMSGVVVSHVILNGNVLFGPLWPFCKFHYL